jgi:serine/threonine protein kinase
MEESFGPWQLGRRVAVGNYADVTEATREERAPVALKRLHAHSAREPELRDLFARECQIAMSVSPHPGLVRGLDTGDVDGRPWMAMNLIGGTDLRRRIDAGAAPDDTRIRTILTELCSALDHLHASGWVHGDVNPANILVEPGSDAGASGFGTPHALLCDFGVARPPGEPGPVRGTHAYMAPEQVRGEPWTPATDVFALGVVLWELVSGERLFRRDATYLSMAAVIEAEPTALAHPLGPVAARALAKPAADRFATPGALAAAIRAT